MRLKVFGFEKHAEYERKKKQPGENSSKGQCGTAFNTSKDFERMLCNVLIVKEDNVDGS